VSSLTIEAETKVRNKISINGGKAPAGESLCQSCTYAHITQGYAESQRKVMCTYSRAHPQPIGFDVKDCTAYVHRNQANLWDMEKIAWILLTKKAGRSTGFVTPGEFREIEGEDAEVLP
jgi:hypothetical protein